MNVIEEAKQVCLTDFTPEELQGELGLKAFKCRQVFRWLHQKGVRDFAAMTDLSKEERRLLSEKFPLNFVEVERVAQSETTGTRKALFRLHDGETVEAVLIPAKDRVTFCLSSQVGCAVKCSFCATGIDGFQRNLSPGEIAEQATLLANEAQLGDQTPNIVYMGMGEPFRNYDNVVKSIRLLMHPEGIGIGARKITVSTAGDIPGIERFAAEDWQVRLSVSLHAANDTVRSKLVPLNRRYPLERLREAIVGYCERAGRQITFEWALLAGVNDSDAAAAELAEFAQGLKATVNLIPYNPVREFSYAPPSLRRCRAFRDALEKRGVRATLRLERGQDINAACGQLRRQSVTA